MSAQPGVPLRQIGVETNAMLNEALWRYGGMHGRVLDLNGNLLHEAIEVQAEVQVDRINVALAGTTRTGYKPGRETREGSITVQKLDTAWEMNLHRWVNLSADQRRELRGTPTALMRPFSLIIEHADPGALGYEQWQLDGCLIWSMNIGMNIGDDVRTNQLPLTWERETPLHAFERTGVIGDDGLPAIKWVGALDPVAAAA
jgi:Phage tail tube protein